MPFSLDDPVLWGVVFLILLVLELLIAANVRAQRAAAKKRAYAPTTEAPALSSDVELTDILSRFAEDQGGRRIGETVGMSGDLLVLKEGKTYRAISYALFRRDGETFRLTGPVDMAEAERKGEAWRDRQHKPVTYTESELPQEDR